MDEPIAAKHPHCDSRVLHAPGKCEFCDRYQDRQNERIAQGINFTGENDPAKKPCPATEVRPLDMIERWPGNRPEPDERKEDTGLNEKQKSELAALAANMHFEVPRALQVPGGDRGVEMFVKKNRTEVAKTRQSWHQYFMSIAHTVATRATCDRKHVGCVLVVDKRIIATGYNGSIPGAPHCDEVGHDLVTSVIRMDGEVPVTGANCVRTVHAEVNAIAQAARNGAATKGADAYVNTFPCWPCFKTLALAGVTRIFYDDEYRNDERVHAAAIASGIVIAGPKDWHAH